MAQVRVVKNGKKTGEAELICCPLIVLLQLFQMRTSGDKRHSRLFSTGSMPSCHPNISVKAPVMESRHFFLRQRHLQRHRCRDTRQADILGLG